MTILEVTGTSSEPPGKWNNPCAFPPLPNELFEKILLQLQTIDILTIRPTSRCYKQFIDKIPELQTKIVRYYLGKCPSNCNIPIDDVKLMVESHKLTLEVHGSLQICKLTFPPLCNTLCCTSCLILKNGEPEELTQLFTQLRNSDRLMALYLWSCNLDEKATDALQLLLRNPRPLQVFIKEPEMIESKEFIDHVHNEASSGNLILEIIEKMNPLIQAEIISSIWHSQLMQINSIERPSRHSIQQQVYAFISNNPHHAAVRAAAKSIYHD